MSEKEKKHDPSIEITSVSGKTPSTNSNAPTEVEAGDIPVDGEYTGTHKPTNTVWCAIGSTSTEEEADSTWTITLSAVPVTTGAYDVMRAKLKVDGREVATSSDYFVKVVARRK